MIIFKDGTISAFGDIFNNGKKYVTEDAISSYNVTAQQGVEVTPTYDSTNKTITFGISITSTPVITDTKLSGYNGIAAAKDGNVSGQWNVGLTNDMLNTINGKLDTTDFNTYTGTTAPSTYQPKGNYLSSNALEGYATTALLDTISSKIESDIPTTVAQLTDSGNYYKKSETSGANELSTEFAKYLTTAQYNTDSATFALKSDLNGLVNSASVTTNDNYVMTNTGWKVLTLPGGGMTKVYHDTTLTGDGNANDNQLGVKWETLSSNTIAYSNSAFNLTNGTSVSSFDQISAAIDSRYSKTASDKRYLQKSLDDTLTGDGKDSSHKLGVAWSALSSNKIDSAKSANSAEYITNGVGYSGFDDISAKFGSLSSYVPFSATELPIGTNNTATTNAAAIGGLNSAVDLSFALGNGNSAKTTGCAIGESNYAYNKSVAIGYQNTADYNVDIAIGYQNSSYDHAAALINHNIAKTYSFAAGDCNTAINYSFTLGRGLKLDNTNGGANSFGGLAIGGWNYTTADAMFVIGNGSPTANKDYFVLKKDGSVAFGEGTSAQFIGSFAEGFHTSAIGVGVRAVGAFTRFSVSNTAEHAVYDWEGRGVTVEGYANLTTAHTYSGTQGQSNYGKIHGGVLKVIGNGAADSKGITGSDAYILYRDGSITAAGKISANGMFAVDSAATLIGASRQTSENYGVNNSAIGTTWVGVGSNGMHQGFIKYSDGGNVGALDTTSTIQLNFKPSTNNFDSVQVQINGNSVGYLIPAVTSTTTAGLTDDGILHIIIES